MVDLTKALGFKDGFVLVTDGQNYATLVSYTQESVENFISAAQGVSGGAAHILLATEPTICKELGVVAVPTLFKIENGKKVAEMVGITNEAQMKAFMLTGVSPL